jgi:predicted flavoprotein YhiN
MSQLAAFLKNLRFPVMGTGDYRQAQATAGGLHGDALDEHLQVKQYPHLYVVGEAVDIHSICGGYHLHWAWSSGWCAARHIAERSIHI